MRPAIADFNGPQLIGLGCRGSTIGMGWAGGSVELGGLNCRQFQEGQHANRPLTNVCMLNRNTLKVQKQEPGFRLIMSSYWVN